MERESLSLRPATINDRDSVNAVIEAAIMTWDIPERVKRLSLPSYRYHDQDFHNLQVVVGEAPEHGIVGVAAWEPADSRDVPGGRRALLLHGIYVLPSHRRGGIGSRLVGAAVQAARDLGFRGLLVKAQSSAGDFFEACGFERLPVGDASRDYPHRFWFGV